MLLNVRFLIQIGGEAWQQIISAVNPTRIYIILPD